MIGDYVEWPDSCLGVIQTDVACTQTITPGYRIIVNDNNNHFGEYHSDLTGRIVFVAVCEGPQPTPAPDPGIDLCMQITAKSP